MKLRKTLCHLRPHQLIILNFPHAAVWTWVTAALFAIQVLFTLIGPQEKETFFVEIGLEDMKNYERAWRVYLYILSWAGEIWYTYRSCNTSMYYVWCAEGIYKIVSMHNVKPYGAVRIQTDAIEPRHFMFVQQSGWVWGSEILTQVTRNFELMTWNLMCPKMV